jgi:hypothetical protein
MMRGDLDAWADLWFWSLVGSTIAVAFGIICEAPEVWQAVGLGHKTVTRIRQFWYIRVRKIDLNGWERICPELITKNERHRKWIARAGFVGWTLVALGVAGEGVAEYFVNDAETNLRNFDQAVLVETQQSANSAAVASSLANAFADRATVASANAMTLARGARKEADSFEQDIVSAKQLAADAESHLADALQRAAAASLELAQLKTLRSLSAKQQERITSKLNPFTPVPFDLWVNTDSDSTALMGMIDVMLRSARWEFKPADMPVMFAEKAGIIAEPGVSVHVPREHWGEWGISGKTLADALAAEGIPTTAFSDNTDTPKFMKRDRIHILIGSKPLK